MATAEHHHAGVDEGAASEGIVPREGQGRVASLGEGARSGKCSAQGLVGRVAEDERGIVGDVSGVGAATQQTRDEQGSSTDRRRAGVGVRAGQLHETRSRLGNAGGGGLGDRCAHQQVDAVGRAACHGEGKRGTAFRPDTDTSRDHGGDGVRKDIHIEVPPLELGPSRCAHPAVALEETPVKRHIAGRLARLHVEMLGAVGDHAALIDHEVRHLCSGIIT